MSTHIIWNCIDALASALEGDRQGIEQLINDLELELTHMSKRRREDIRRMLIVIVAGLSRLEVRMMETDGPLNVGC
jgi:hypothetical protein